MLLVAFHGPRHCLICAHVPHMPSPTDPTNCDTVPLTIATPASLFAKMYMDTMHLKRSGGFSYIVQGRCSLTHYSEFRMLQKETAQTIVEWIFQDILCRWGTLVRIVSDNGKPFVAALKLLEKKYHVKHIRISGYNSHANGIIKRSHFNV